MQLYSAIHSLSKLYNTPLYKPRDSARSALLTAVRNRRSGLAVHPRRVLHGLAAPDWRGEHVHMYMCMHM